MVELAFYIHLRTCLAMVNRFVFMSVSNIPFHVYIPSSVGVYLPAITAAPHVLLTLVAIPFHCPDQQAATTRKQ